MSKGFTIAEEGHLVTLFDPQDLGTAGTSDTFLMEGWGHASMILAFGAGSGCTVTVGECTGFGGTGRTAVTFRSAQEATHAGDVLDAALAWASTLTIAAGTGGVAIIELDADELTDGYPYVQVNVSDPGTSKLMAGIAVLSGGRYQKDITATAIA